MKAFGCALIVVVFYIIQRNKLKYYLYTDGAARGNPGPAGAGIYVVDENGNQVGRCCKYLGETTNNVAEYEALLMGLKYAQKEKLKHLTIYADSELMVKQVRGEYRVKNKRLNILYQQVMELLPFFDYRMVHVRRERNKIADLLANEAIDKALAEREG